MKITVVLYIIYMYIDVLAYISPDYTFFVVVRRVRLGSGVSSTTISVLLFLRQFPRIGASEADF